MALLHDDKGTTIQIVALLRDDKGATIQIVALLHDDKGATIQIVALLHDDKGATIQIVVLLHDDKGATIRIAVLLHENLAPQLKFQSKNMTQSTKISYLCTVVQQIKQIKTKNNYEKTKFCSPARHADLWGG